MINPLVLSLGGAFDAEVDPLLPKPKKSSTKADIKYDNDDGLGYFMEGASNDSDEEGSTAVLNGVRKTCFRGVSDERF